MGEARQERYLFVIGDELNKPRLSARHVRAVIGDDLPHDVTVESVYRELEQRWNVFFILPNQSSYYGDPEIVEHWTRLLGERFLELDDPAAVCELIALTIGIGEDRIDLGEGLADLREIGSTHEAASVGTALERVTTARPPVATSALPLGDPSSDDISFE